MYHTTGIPYTQIGKTQYIAHILSYITECISTALHKTVSS